MSEWIGVEDRLPEESTALDIKPVLVFEPTGNGITFGWYIHDEWRIIGSPNNWPVTHWMPLPDPPEE
jgi:hypothetical protein